MNDKFALWILMGALAVPAGILSYFMERQRARHYPEGTSYQWGYFISLDVALLGAFVLGNAIFNMISGRYISLTWKLVFGSTYFLVGWLGTRRSRTGLVASTLLTLNPLFYLVSALYLRHRWKELGNPTAVTTSGGRRRERVYRNMY